MTSNRTVASVSKGQTTADGAGVKLTRLLSPSGYSRFDPFLLLDEFASDQAADYLAGFPDHPHRGFATVTYMLDGAMRHRDHMGNEGHLRPGDVQWMVAGRGIIHSEMPEQTAGLMRGFQLWLNLPAKEKMQPPQYRDIAAASIPQTLSAAGGQVKIIAGAFAGKPGAVTGVSTRPTYLDVALPAHQTLAIPVAAAHTALVLVYEGQLSVADGHAPIAAGQLAHLVDGGCIHLSTDAAPARLLLLAAQPLHEPIVHAGPFVMNTQAEIEQAFSDYRKGVLAR